MSDPNLEPIDRRMQDGGPSYIETPGDLENFAGTIAEPWNTGSALLFIVVALVWTWALRGRYRRHPFLTMCLPLLATGGLGGVLYHGMRKFHVFFLMDVIPIYLLGLCVTLWLWIRLGPRIRHLLGVIAFLAFLQMIAQFRLPIQWAINISYASLALLMILPLTLALLRTRFLNAGWVYTALASFAIAWTCRISDTIRPPLLPMGTHWLWHVFGTLTTVALSMYVYRIEGVSLRKNR